MRSPSPSSTMPVASPSFNPPVLPPLPSLHATRAPLASPAPPSPSTTAAALSLGALATAATLATAAPTPSSVTVAPTAPVAAPTPPAPSAPRASMQPLSRVSATTAATTVAPPRRPKQRRYRASPAQLTHLLAKFESNPSPSSAELQQLAAAIDMPLQSAVLWFKNRRARVPHKKAEKAAAAARRRAAAAAMRRKQEEVAAATCMAELAMTRTAPPLAMTPRVHAQSMEGGVVAHTPLTDSGGAVAANEFKKESGGEGAGASELLRSPPPSHFVGNSRNEPCTPVSTARRPRARFIPPTPRLFSQREYKVGDGVEVMESEKGICRSWYSAVIVSRAPSDICLGASAGGSADGSAVTGAKRVVHDSSVKSEAEGCDNEKDDGDESPRTVRSPVASPTPAVARIWYVVRYEHRFDANGNKLEEAVLAKRMRPKAPELDAWRPDIGDAIEVLKDGGWFIGVIQTLVIRKGYLVSFENGQVEWTRRHLLRAYQIWRGGDNWVVKKKAPLMVVRKSVGLSVTHPVCGKRRSSGTGGEGDTKGGRKRAKSAVEAVADGSGPDGLPEGWRVGSMSGVNGATVYVAPDGHRLRSLKEAQRYVKLMRAV
eukprot:TRINITY_DN41_c0_g2_i1.p1 TRINITY_DN41_c0_g2~~TRINITY_DN41_c0_g2_i1.p1  ORF type:complete len:600 (-),score=127.94 TRINITY_DN41_c0_g2_i1:16394-18193(-)